MSVIIFIVWFNILFLIFYYFKFLFNCNWFELVSKPVFIRVISFSFTCAAIWDCILICLKGAIKTNFYWVWLIYQTQATNQKVMVFDGMRMRRHNRWKSALTYCCFVHTLISSPHFCSFLPVCALSCPWLCFPNVSRIDFSTTILCLQKQVSHIE